MTTATTLVRLSAVTFRSAFGPGLHGQGIGQHLVWPTYDFLFRQHRSLMLPRLSPPGAVGCARASESRLDHDERQKDA